jgi:hypothetical protein
VLVLVLTDVGFRSEETYPLPSSLAWREEPREKLKENIVASLDIDAGIRIIGDSLVGVLCSGVDW